MVMRAKSVAARTALYAVFLTWVLSGCIMVSDELLGRDTGVASSPREVQPVEESAGELSPRYKELTPAELHSAVLSYADRYMEGIAEAVDEVLERGPAPEVRALFQGTKVVYVSSAITIAAEPNPGISLLDMAVMVSLQRIVWEEEWGSYVDREYAAIMKEALRKLEADIFHLASKVLTDAQLGTLRELIEEWRGENPEQRYVAYVRFDDFAASQRHMSFQEELRREGGLLAPLKDVGREIEKIAMLAERGIFLANHFPILAEWHMDFFFSKVASSSEVSVLLEDSHAVVESSARLVEVMERLPDRLSRERAALLEDLAKRVAEERKRTIDHFVAAVQEQREGLLRDLREGDEELVALMEKVESAGTVLRDTAQSLERLFRGDKPKAPPKEPGEKSGLEALDVTLGNISSAAAELNLLVRNLEEITLDRRAATLLDDVDARLRAHEKRLFYYGTGLIVLFFLGLTVFSVITRALRNSR